MAFEPMEPRVFWPILVTLVAFSSVSSNSSITTKSPHVFEFDLINETQFELWKKSMDLSANPCTNFYQFMCGSSKSREGDIFERVDEIEKCKLDALTGNYESKSEAVHKMRQYRDAKWGKSKTRVPLTQLIDEVKNFGSCPLLERRWSSSNYNLTHALHSFATLTGRMPLFGFDIHPISSSTAYLKLIPENLTNIDYSYFFNEKDHEKIEVRSAMRQFLTAQMTSVINETGLNSKHRRSYLLRQIEQTLKIDTHIYQEVHKSGFNKWSEMEFEYDRYGNEIMFKLDRFDKIRFNHLDKLLPIVGTQHFLNSPHILPEVRDYLLTDPLIFVDKKQLFSELNDFYSKLDMETLANYLCIKFFHLQVHHAGFDYKKLNNTAVRTLEQLPLRIYGGPSRMEWELPHHFWLTYDHIFLKHCVDETVLNEVREMAKAVKVAARQMLNETDWLDDETKGRALYKLQKMQMHIGASDIAVDITSLDKFYSILNFLPTDNLRELDRKLRIFNWQTKLRQSVHPEEFDEVTTIYYMPVVNSFFSFQNNRITITGGYINATENYNSRLPASVRFGSLGSTIGHEIFHSYTGGIFFDERGELSDWFKPWSMEGFEERGQCFVDQYTNIFDVETKEHLNGKLTFTEDLPDHAGLRAAFRAFKNFNGTWRETKFKTTHTPEQLFFMSYAVLFCGANTREQKLSLINKDKHSPDMYRVNEVLKNMPEFSQSFACPVGSTMNPKEKCKTW